MRAILKFLGIFFALIILYGCSPGVLHQYLNSYNSSDSSSQESEIYDSSGSSSEESNSSQDAGSTQQPSQESNSSQNNSSSQETPSETGESNASSTSSTDVLSYLSNAPIVGFVKLNVEDPVDFNKIVNSNFYGATIDGDYVVWEVSGNEMLDLIARYGYDELEGVYDKQSLKFKFALAKDGTLWVGIEGSKEAIISYMTYPSNYVGGVPDVPFAKDKGLTDQEIASMIRNWDLNKTGITPALFRMTQLLIYNNLINYASDKYTIDKDNFYDIRIKDFYFLEKGVKNNIGDLIYIYYSIIISDKNTYGDRIIPSNLAWSPLTTHTSTGSGKRGFTLVYKNIPQQVAFSIFAHSDNGNSAYAKADSYRVEEVNWYPGHAKFIYGYAPKEIELGVSIVWSWAIAHFVMVYIGSPDDVTWTNVWQDPPGGLSNNPPPVKGVLKKGWNFYKYSPASSTSALTAYTILDTSFEEFPTGSLPDGFVIIYDGKGTSYQSVVDTISFTGSKSLRVWGVPGWCASLHYNFNIFDYEKIEVSWKMYATENNDGWLHFVNQSGATWGWHWCDVGLARKQGSYRIAYIDSNGNKIIEYVEPDKVPIKVNEWNDIKIILDTQITYCEAYLNGHKLYEATLDLNTGWAEYKYYFLDGTTKVYRSLTSNPSAYHGIHGIRLTDCSGEEWGDPDASPSFADVPTYFDDLKIIGYK